MGPSQWPRAAFRPKRPVRMTNLASPWLDLVTALSNAAGSAPGERSAALASQAVRFPSFVDQLPLTRDALQYAAARHTGQRRSADHAPFILHPLEVAHLLRGRDYPDEVVAAGVLHDVIEDTDASRADLAERFGSRVAELVGAVSEPLSHGSYAERKARLREAVSQAPPDAVAIYAADKVAKLRELRIVIATTTDYEPDTEQLDHYWASLELLEARDVATPLVRQLRFELEALAMLPPDTTGD